MPVRVVRKPVKGGKNWALVEASGKIVGRSSSEKKAKAAARARNAAFDRKRRNA